MIAALLLLAGAATEANCGDLPQQPMNMCLLEAYRRDDAELNRLWPRAMAAMREQDRAIDRTYDKQATHAATLLAAQRNWIAFRDQQCLLESFEMRGGSGAPMLHSLCMSRLTRERIGQLKDLLEGN